MVTEVGVGGNEPRRGSLFIDDATAPPRFCFRRRGLGCSAHKTSRWARPILIYHKATRRLKTKIRKIRNLVVTLAIKRPPLRPPGFESSEARKLLSSFELCRAVLVSTVFDFSPANGYLG